MLDWSDKFLNRFHTEAEIIVKAPGRINIIGEHTDYNLGFVLPAAIDRGIYFACAENDDTVIEVYAEDFDESIRFPADIKSPGDGKSWMRYIRAIIVQLNLRGHYTKTFKCIFGGDIPQGGGMSSSAALCCGLIFTLNELNDWQLTRKQIALIAQAAEHSIGIKCGIMDQYASLFGKKGQVMLLDCRTLETQHFPMELGNYTLFLINSQQTHEFATENEYNVRRSSCEKVAGILGLKSLRDADESLLELHKDEIDPESYMRALYVIEENKRVLSLVGALREGKLDLVGSILKNAQEGMKNLYQITTPEIDFLADFINTYPGALGARMMGGGFGGCTINMVLNEVFDQCIEEVISKYKSKFGRAAEIYLLHLEDGVNVV